jgi:tetratricopeptide (TPR) repeat protein/predicted membrane-bound spermidine synthase
MAMAVPAATIFTSSFCIMVLEIVAARLVARHLGSSLYTWTAVIGVVLAGISLGNYLGGRIADRFAAAKALVVLFAVSSASCVAAVVLNNLAAQWLWPMLLSWPARVFTHVLVVFILPSTMLGTISPVVAKMALDRGLPTGRTVGGIYAWGAIGSIAGTLAAGYYLIAAMGTVAIVWAVGGVLLLMAILYCGRLLPLCVLALAFLVVMTVATAPALWCRAAGTALALRERPEPDVVYSDETPYCRVWVKRRPKNPQKRIFMQDKLAHSEMVMNDITNLQYFYTKIYAAITRGLAPRGRALSVLVIGGGGYVWPRYVEHAWPGSRIDVVEIDPGVTEAAFRAFGLSRQTSVNTITMDARNYVDGLLRRPREGGLELYDFIYEDAISDYSVPFQLVTTEFTDSISRLLAGDGIYMLTLIDVYDCGGFLGAVVNTFERTFDHVYVVTQAGMPESVRNTFVVVGSARPVDLEAVIAGAGIAARCLEAGETDSLKARTGGLVLTDDYAPVENLLAPVVLRSAKGFLAHRYIEIAGDLAAAGRLDEAAAAYEKAALVKPELAVEAHCHVGMLRLRQGGYDRAAGAFELALAHNEKTGGGRSTAPIHFNLGLALENTGRAAEAAVHFKRAIEAFESDLAASPGSAEIHAGLGRALMEAGETERGLFALERAVELNPDDPAGHANLIAALGQSGYYDSAVEALKRLIDNRKGRGHGADAAALRKLLEYLELKRLQLHSQPKRKDGL